MPSNRFLSITCANLLIPIACLVFATGFFPYKPFLPGLATFQDVVANEEMEMLRNVTRPPRVFDKVIFMVVDALRRLVDPFRWTEEEERADDTVRKERARPCKVMKLIIPVLERQQRLRGDSMDGLEEAAQGQALAREPETRMFS